MLNFGFGLQKSFTFVTTSWLNDGLKTGHELTKTEISVAALNLRLSINERIMVNVVFLFFV